MLKIQLLFLCTFLLFKSSLAKDEKVIHIREGSVDITLLGFKVVDIIDARKFKENIGFVQVGMANKKVPAVTEKGLALELMESLVQYDRDLEVAIRINGLFISELTKGFSEIGTVELSLDFFLVEDGQYFYLSDYYSFIENKSGTDVTNKHDKYIGIALYNLLYRLHRNKDTFSKTTGLTREEVTVGEYPPSYEETFKILTDSLDNDGIYYSFKAFKENKPEARQIKVSEKNGNYIVKTQDENGKWDKVKDAYAVSYDGNLYKYFYGRYYRIFRDLETDLSFQGPRVNYTSVDEVYWGVAFGLIGGLISAAASQDDGTSPTTTYYLDKKTGIPIDVDLLQENNDEILQDKQTDGY